MHPSSSVVMMHGGCLAVRPVLSLAPDVGVHLSPARSLSALQIDLLHSQPPSIRLHLSLSSHLVSHLPTAPTLPTPPSPSQLLPPFPCTLLLFSILRFFHMLTNWSPSSLATLYRKMARRNASLLVVRDTKKHVRTNVGPPAQCRRIVCVVTSYLLWAGLSTAHAMHPSSLLLLLVH